LRRSGRAGACRTGSDLDLLVDFGLPALVFLALAVWLIRKALKAARTEDDLAHQRFEGAFAEELAKGRALAAGQPSNSTSTSNSNLNSNSPLQPSLLWRHVTSSHTVWCERLPDGREVVRVSRAGSQDVIAEFS
jgi:hypothetical protein